MTRYLSSAPVLLMVLLTFTAGILIEFKRFFPDLLSHPLEVLIIKTIALSQALELEKVRSFFVC